jgi:hypothetical protein
MAGTVERGVLADLRTLPQYIRDGSTAKAALTLARIIDGPVTEPKDVTAATRVLLVAMAEISAKAPRKGVKDGVEKARDDLAARRAAKRARSS